MATVFIALGTNLGDREENLTTAQGLLQQEMRIVSSSRIHETLPWGVLDQPNFLNQVLEGESGFAPGALLLLLKAIETGMGRTASRRYGPRLIDLDILYYDNLVLETPALQIPHPRLHERRFVLEPLAEIAPDRVHPLLGRTTLALLQSLSRSEPDHVR